jgi:hypothetical protein
MCNASGEILTIIYRAFFIVVFEVGFGCLYF